MNAPYDRVLVNADGAHRSTDPVEVADVGRDSIRASSRPLGWKPLNIERRELEPGGDCLPGGVTEHLILVSVADGHVIRESGGDIADKELEAGLVSIHPSDTPVRWAWDTRLSFTMMSLEPEYLNKVARESFAFDPAHVRLKTVEGRRDPVITSIAGALVREGMSGDASRRRSGFRRTEPSDATLQAHARHYTETIASVVPIHATPE